MPRWKRRFRDYGAEIERMEAMSAMDAQFKPTSTPITEKPYERHFCE